MREVIGWNYEYVDCRQKGSEAVETLSGGAVSSHTLVGVGVSDVIHIIVDVSKVCWRRPVAENLNDVVMVSLPIGGGRSNVKVMPRV